jgi:hypothetical protein
MEIGDYLKEEVGFVLAEVIYLLREPQDTWISNLIDILFAQEKSWTFESALDQSQHSIWCILGHQ